MENGSDFCSSLDNNSYYMDIIDAAMDGSHQNCSVTNVTKSYCEAKNYMPKKKATPRKTATPKKSVTPKKAKSPKKEKTEKSKKKNGKSKNKNYVNIKIDVELMCSPCQVGEEKEGTRRHTHTRTHKLRTHTRTHKLHTHTRTHKLHTHTRTHHGKRHRSKYVKNNLDFMLNGFVHEGYMKSRTYSQYCGSPLSPLPKGQKSCSKYTIILI